MYGGYKGDVDFVVMESKSNLADGKFGKFLQHWKVL